LKLVSEFNGLNFQAVTKNIPTTTSVKLQIKLHLCFQLLISLVGTQCACGCQETVRKILEKMNLNIQ